MERQFIFDNFHTFTDWRLILTAKSITPPELKTNYIELDGTHGSLDLSEALTGGITYKDRSISASFLATEGNHSERSTLLKNITNLLHGRKVKIIEPDDVEHYLYGRIAIKSINNILPYSELTLEAICEPWRYSINDTVRLIDVNNTNKSVILYNRGSKTIVPDITIVGNITIVYNDIKIPLTTGNYRVSELRLRTGSNVLDIFGNGSVKFTYTEADI